MNTEQEAQLHREASRRRDQIVPCSRFGLVLGTVLTWLIERAIVFRIVSLPRGLSWFRWTIRRLIRYGLLRYEPRQQCRCCRSKIVAQ